MKFLLNSFFVLLVLISSVGHSQINSPGRKSAYPDFVDTVKLNELKKKSHRTKIETSETDSLADVQKLLIENSTESVGQKLRDTLGVLSEFSRADSAVVPVRPLSKWSLAGDSVKRTDFKKKVNQGAVRKRVNESIDMARKKKSTLSGRNFTQYDYGALPYYMSNTNFPGYVFKLFGDLKINLKGLPLSVEYLYSTPKVPSGLNNYFTLRLDVNALMEQQKFRYLEQATAMRERMDSLQREKQKLNNELLFAENLRREKMAGADLPKVVKPSFQQPKINLRDSMTELTSIPGGTTFPIHSAVSDSLDIHGNRFDTSYTQIVALKQSISKIEDQLSFLDRRSKNIEYNPVVSTMDSIYPNKRTTKLASGIKSFEAGVCYPKYSAFVLNQISLKGINLGYAYKNVFFYTTYGKTIVNYSVAPLSNALGNQIQSFGSFFDWNGAGDERKIAAMKIGFGKEDKSYIGFTSLRGVDNRSATGYPEKNYAFEMDAKVRIGFVTVETAVAKSFLKNSELSAIEESTSDRKLIGSLSNSYQGRLSGTVPKLKTKISLLCRAIEPNFKSYGIGFLRSDVLRYDLKFEQPVYKLMKVAFNYRRDENNIRNRLQTKTLLRTFNYLVKAKLFHKKADLILNYVEIFHDLALLESREQIRTKSTIKTLVLTNTSKVKRVISTNNLIINNYLIKDPEQASTFNSCSLNSINQWKKWQFGISSAFSNGRLKDSANYTNAISNRLEVARQIGSKWKATIIAKHAFGYEKKITDYGCGVLINYNINKVLQFEMKVEKLVVGDYLNTLGYRDIQKFPFYGYLKCSTTF